MLTSSMGFKTACTTAKNKLKTILIGLLKNVLKRLDKSFSDKPTSGKIIYHEVNSLELKKVDFERRFNKNRGEHRIFLDAFKREFLSELERNFFDHFPVSHCSNEIDRTESYRITFYLKNKLSDGR